MNAEILCVGTELLIGDIVNTNASYISKALSYHGINVLYHSVCGDNAVRLEQTLHLALLRSDIVVTTGGLGPTYDDITKSICASAFDLPLVMDENVKNELFEYFKKSNRTMTENNLSQALVPKGAKVFSNAHGTAPGICIEKDGKIIIMLPGPPREMIPMMDNAVLPYLSKYTKTKLFSSNVNVFGMGESSVDQKLHALMSCSENPTVAPYVADGEVRLRVTANAENKDSAQKLIAPVIQQIKDQIGEFVYGVDSQGLEYELVRALKEKKLTVATAESCTGGLVSKMITEVSGSSEVFGFGVCTYANEAKIKLLSVSEKTLDEFGAVSYETACEMAKGAKELSCADIAISLTGIAGPTGGTADKPVGLVYLGVALKDRVYAKKLLLCQHSKPDRAYIRMCAAKNALKTALDEVLEY